MTQPITYQCFIDTAKTATYAQSIDDVSAYVVSANWNIGMGAPYEEISAGSQLTITLDNRSKVFLPRVIGSDLVTNGDFSAWTGGQPDWWTTVAGPFNSVVSQVGRSDTYLGSGSGACNIFKGNGFAINTYIQMAIATEKTYKVSLSITYRGTTLGGVDRRFRYGIAVYNGNTRVSDYWSEPGNYTTVFKDDGSGTVCIGHQAEHDAEVNITIDDVSVFEVSPYYNVNRGTLVKFSGTYNGDTQQYYEGRILDIQHGIAPMSGNIQGRSVTLIVGEPTDDMQRANINPPLQENVTAKDVLERVFDEAVVAYPYTGKYAILDSINANGILDYCYLYDHDALDATDTGQTTHAFLGDNSDRGQGVSVWGYLSDVNAAECGGRLFWQGRTSKYTFHDRHHDLQNDTIAGTLDGVDILDAPPVSYSQGGAYLSNSANIQYMQRKVGTPGTVVWTMQNLPIMIKNGSKKSVTAKFYDPDNEKASVSVKDEIDPQVSVDYTANDAETGGNDVSNTITLFVEWGTTSAKVTFENVSGQDIWLTSAQLRGTPLIAIPETATALDPTSKSNYNEIETTLEIRLLSDRNTAEDYAHFLVSKFKDPLTQFNQFSIEAYANTTTRTAAHTWTVGTKITITDDYTEHDADYVVVGEQHSINIGQPQEHIATYIVKPNSREKFARLDTDGYDELDSAGCRLAF